MAKSATRRNRTPNFNQSTTQSRESIRWTKARWLALEEAYGLSARGLLLSSAARTDLVAIVDSYLEWAPFEEQALPVSTVETEIRRVMYLVEKIQNVPCESEAGRHAQLAIAQMMPWRSEWYGAEEQRRAALREEGYAEESIGLPDEERDLLQSINDLHDSQRQPTVPVALIRQFFSDVLMGCSHALAEMKRVSTDQSGFDRGDNWSVMICDLIRWGEKHELPVTISKGRKKWHNDARPSPFVAFVWALQELLPPSHQRHMESSIDALATAMSSVRAKARKRKANAGC